MATYQQTILQAIDIEQIYFFHAEILSAPACAVLPELAEEAGKERTRAPNGIRRLPVRRETPVYARREWGAEPPAGIRN
jgi:hypothetical protein